MTISHSGLLFWATLYLHCFTVYTALLYLVSRDQILVIFGILVANEICNRKMLTCLKEIAGALRQVVNQLRHIKIVDDAYSENMVYSVEHRILIENAYKFKNYGPIN